MIIGTRGSDLARVQTDTVVSMLKERRPDINVDVKIVKTTGDIVKDKPLSEMGSPGVFTKELDRLIISGEVDAAVNSLKDMPVDLTEGTELAAVLPRAPSEDVLISRVSFEQLPSGAVVGTSSTRRRMQLISYRPDLDIRDLRGNVPTRIRKWKEGEYDAIVAARAGLVRLGLDEECHILDPDIFIPAPGQGAVAVVCRADSPYLSVLQELDDIKARKEVEAERFVLKALGGGCSMPIGVSSRVVDENMHIKALVNSEHGDVRVERTLTLDDYEGLNDLVQELLEGMS
ncbi:MAG: hydroxymethylbilane synthase [Euryarchaeota archaeon]|nr:hydroxymethylbilane synthase [Euryarchaeota archaeon]